MSNDTAHSFSPNLILSALTPAQSGLLKPHLEHVHLRHGQTLIEADRIIEHIYFPEGGIVSTTARTAEAGMTEIGIVGYEGLTGTAVLLGSDRMPHDTFVQVDGSTAFRIEAAHLLRACDSDPSLRTLLLRYVQTFIVQAAQSAVANAHYKIEARLARWLLMCHDRLPGSEISLTHEFMSMMIAAQRPGVTETLHVLEGEGLIRATRGKVAIRDRSGLEARAGDSYGSPEREYRRLIGPFGKSGSA